MRAVMWMAIAGAGLAAGAEPKHASEPRLPDHRQLLVYLDEGGRVQPVTTAQQWSRRREQILRGMEEAMGPLPDRSGLGPPDVEVLQQHAGDGFRRLTLSMVPEPGDRLRVDLYLPADLAPGQRRPAMLALHPTSRLGKDVVAGLGPLPNRAYALELAQRGYVVVAPDYPSFGDSKDYRFDEDRYASGSMKGIFNHMRSVDLLCAREEVDPQRIGVIGHSLGGHNALFVAVFDTRLKVVVSSCGWCPFHDYRGANLLPWSKDCYMPRIREAYGLDPDRVPFDFYEVVAALAPRAFFSNSPLRDSNFDVAGVKKGIAEAGKVYRLLGVPDALQARHPDSAHDFVPEVRREAYEFIDRALAHTPSRSVP